MSRLAILALSCVVAAACSDASSVAPLTPSDASAASSHDRAVRVINYNNDGPGSFRAAIAKANENPSVGRIEFPFRSGVVQLSEPVVYTGAQSLTIEGFRATLDGSGLTGTGGAFQSVGGGDLSVNGLTVRNAPDAGIEVNIPSDATGLKKVTLIGVEITGNDGHGVVINDQTFPEEAGDADANPPIPPNPAGSAASLKVVVFGAKFDGNGFGASDRDGLRINEGGDGDLFVSISLSHASNNGADGIELDERGAGTVQFDLVGSQLSGNGSLDPSDFDDGIDVDEAGAGDLVGRIAVTSANDNFEEGFDLNENDAGDFRVTMTLVEASRNREEGIDFEEDDDFAGGGDLVTTLTGIKANGNAAGDAGLKIREKGDGNLDATVTGLEASDNLTSGVQVREDAAGNLVAVIRHAVVNHNANHGIDFDENAAGNLTATVAQSSSTNNTGFGVRADNAGAGVGTLLLEGVTLTGNGSGPVGGGGVTVTQTP